MAPAARAAHGGRSRAGRGRHATARVQGGVWARPSASCARSWPSWGPRTRCERGACGCPD